MSRVINRLRKLFPDGEWVYEHHTWINKKTGDTVVGVAHHSPLYDGDEDRFITRYQLNYPTGPYLNIEDYRIFSCG